MATDYNLVDIQTAKSDYLDIKHNDDDNLIKALIEGVTAAIETYCNRQFVARDYVEYQDGDGLDTFYTDHFPINSITSIYDDADRVFSADTLVNADDYTYYPESGIVSLLGTGSVIGRNFRNIFASGYRNIKITYNAGYSAVPSDLKMIAGEVIAKKFKAIKSKRIGIIGIGSAGENIAIAINDISDESKMILSAKYRKKGTQ